jgi:deoxyadenosine/deoxycytidine kinase
MKVALRGIIGAGKTTFTAAAAELGWPCSYEPVEENPYLQDFYAGDDSVVLPMEMYLALARQRQFKAIHASPTDEIADRSPEEDLIFAQLLNEDGRFGLDDYHDYLHIYSSLFRDVPKLDVVIWLKVSPQTALKRIRARGRESEMQVSDEDWLSYLTRLSDAYEAQHVDENVMVVDWENLGDVADVLRRARQFHLERQAIAEDVWPEAS